MTQIQKFAEATGLALRKRQPKDPFLVDYAIRVVGPDDAPRFELWRRCRGAQPEVVDDFGHFGAAQAGADSDLGCRVPPWRWQEADAWS